MQDSLHFPASKKKAALLLLGSLTFVALGAWMHAHEPVIGWRCMVFFGLGIPVALFIAFTKRIYLLLDAQGFEVGSTVKTVRIAWTEVDGFEMVSLNGTKMIAIHYNKSYEAQRGLRGAVRAISGLEGAIMNLYTAPLPKLLQYLQGWHARFGHTAAMLQQGENAFVTTRIEQITEQVKSLAVTEREELLSRLAEFELGQTDSWDAEIARESQAGG